MPTCESFKKEFLEYHRLSDHEQIAMKQLTRRFQGIEDTAKDYTREFRKIMRFTRLNDQQKLEWSYWKSKTEFKRYANRGECRSLSQYLQLAEDFEAPQDKEARQIERTQGSTSQFRLHPKTILNQGIVSAFSMNNICSKCKRTGHIARGCGNSPRLFCRVCGQDGTQTIH